MKIYFAGSIRGGRDDQTLYAGIIRLLSEHGEVLTEHIGKESITAQGQVEISDSAIYQQDTTWLSEAEVVVAEVSNPSLGVGYEVGRAEGLGKKILCLFREAPDRRLSAMIAGNPHLHVERYGDLEDIPAVLSRFFTTAS